MPPLPSPYNFVPVTGWIYYPPWAGQVSHDVPFADGICGSFGISVNAETPIYIRNQGLPKMHPRERGQLVGAARARYAGFYQAFDGGPYAIPGSSLKGMIRAVVEIVSFGKLGRTVAPNIAEKFNGRHRHSFPPDLAETIFGFANGRDALRGRVAFDTLEAVPGTTHPLPEVRGVLGQPHVGYAPAYVVQPHADPADGAVRGPLLQFGHPDSRLRGWKRYPARQATSALPPIPVSPTTGETNYLVGTYFCPLDTGACFTGRVRVHNLRPIELGALVWALTWGGRPSLRHGLGMAKPCGYGQVTIALDNAPKLERVNGKSIDAAAVLACRDQFVRDMESTRRGGWAASEPIRSLLAMADPASTPPMELRYATRDECNDAKEHGPALLPYLTAPPPPRINPASSLFE